MNCNLTEEPYIKSYSDIAFITESKNEMLSQSISMSKIIAAYDIYTYQHSVNVAGLSRHFAQHLNLSAELIDIIFCAGLIHDYGKIFIPKNILHKPGRLTELEFDMIKLHPKFAAEALLLSSEMKDICKGVHYHHERWDGFGYPNKLKGFEIPLTARILGIADSFDAMTSDRPYKRSYSLEAAQLELLELSGKQFDPLLIPEFLSMIEKITIKISNY